MLQRQTVRRALERRRATHGNTPQFKKAEELIEVALASPDDCWDELVGEYRRNYADVRDEIAAILVDTDDALIIYNTLRVLDLNDPQEAEVVRKIVRDVDPNKHEVSMLGLTGEPTLRAALRKKGKLPESVLRALDPPEEEAAPPSEGGGKTTELKEPEKKAPPREPEKKAPTREAEKRDAPVEPEKPTGIKPPPKPQRTVGKKKAGDAGAGDDSE